MLKGILSKERERERERWKNAKEGGGGGNIYKYIQVKKGAKEAREMTTMQSLDGWLH